MAKVLLNVRIEPELRERLQAEAKRQNRTLSNLVETALLQVVAGARPYPKKRIG